MLNVKCFLRMRNGEWPCGMLGGSHRFHGATQMPFGMLLSKTRDSAKPHRPKWGNFTDAHGSVFSRILYSCSASYCLVFDASPARRMSTDSFAGWTWNASVEIWEICGRQLSAQCAWKSTWENSPTDRRRSQMPCGARGGVSTCFMCVMKEFTFFLWWI